MHIYSEKVLLRLNPKQVFTGLQLYILDLATHQATAIMIGLCHRGSIRVGENAPCSPQTILLFLLQDGKSCGSL